MSQFSYDFKRVGTMAKSVIIEKSKSRSLELDGDNLSSLRLKITAKKSDDVGKLDCFIVSWSNKTVSMIKPRRKYHSLSMSTEDLYIYGGENKKQGKLSEFAQFNITTQEWKVINSPSTMTPPALSKHCSSIIEKNLYLFGGEEEEKIFTGMYRINLG